MSDSQMITRDVAVSWLEARRARFAERLRSIVADIPPEHREKYAREIELALAPMERLDFHDIVDDLIRKNHGG